MNNLKAGFGRCDITPSMGVKIQGYYKVRIADGVLDNLEANAVAVSDGKNTVVFISLDLCSVEQEVTIMYKDVISKRTGLPKENIIISSTHTHTAGNVERVDTPENEFYREFVGERAADAAEFAIKDLKNAKLGYGIGIAPNIAFIRRFKMKDGTTKTNPGMGNPDISEPIGKVDEEVSVLRFDRENAESIVIMNFGNHPDVVGGCKISADWPGFARRTLERAVPGVKSMFINGAEGDVNHVNVFAKDGDLNDLKNDFDDVLRGYGHARHMGNVVAAAVLQTFDKVNYIEAENIRIIEKTMHVPSNLPSKEDMPLAHKYNDLHKAGRDDEIPFKAMDLTTVVAEAERMVALENGPDAFDMNMTCVAIGDIAFVTIPGEGFNYIGRELKKAKGWKMVIPCMLTNGCEGYFPTIDSYSEGGYEARSSIFKAGVAEFLVEEGCKSLNDIKKL